ncbi:DUF7446 family protein [Enterobacter hormaechei]
MTKRILAGSVKAKRIGTGVREFTGEKFEVTDEALFAVAQSSRSS